MVSVHLVSRPALTAVRIFRLLSCRVSILSRKDCSQDFATKRNVCAPISQMGRKGPANGRSLQWKHQVPRLLKAYADTVSEDNWQQVREMMEREIKNGWLKRRSVRRTACSIEWSRRVVRSHMDSSVINWNAISASRTAKEDERRMRMGSIGVGLKYFHPGLRSRI